MKLFFYVLFCKLIAKYFITFRIFFFYVICKCYFPVLFSQYKLFLKYPAIAKFLLLFKLYVMNISSVTRQKGESQNGCFKKAKHAKISEKQTFLTSWYAHVRFGVLCFLETPVLRFTLLPYSRRYLYLCGSMLLPIQKFTVLDHVFVRLTSKIWIALERICKSRGFESHIRLALYLQPENFSAVLNIIHIKVIISI